MKLARELLDAHLNEMKVDFEAWCALYADDALMEYPFGAYAGVSSPLRGIADIAKSVKGFLDAVTDFQTTIMRVHTIEGEDAVIAEFTGSAKVINTGRLYKQDYVVYLQAAKGKIVVLREYFDAPRVVAAFKP